MKVLFIGGSGRISTAVSKLAVEKGIQLYILNRGLHNHKLPSGVHIIKGNNYDKEEMKSLMKGYQFDVVVQWISYTLDDVKRDFEVFFGHTKQFIFISSASAYQKPVSNLPVKEEYPLGNEYWEYSRNKIKCEEYLLSKHSEDFNVTIIRPSHTYDDTNIILDFKPYDHPFTIVKRILNDQEIVIPNNGETLWTLTYSGDFAHAFVDVLGKEETYGEVYHLTSDFVFTWEKIYELLGDALNKKLNTLFIPTDYIVGFFPEYEGDLKGDKNHHFYFDNSKIKTVAPNYKSETDYSNIVKIALNRLLETVDLQTVDDDFNSRYNHMIEEYKKENNL